MTLSIATPTMNLCRDHLIRVLPRFIILAAHHGSSGRAYLYLFEFGFINALRQPIEIVSVNVFDVKGERVKQDWAMSGPNADPRLFTHELSGSHPLSKMFSKEGGDGTPLEQATVSSSGGRPEVKVTNRILSSGEGVRPSKYVLGSKNKYDSLTLRVVYRVDGKLQEVSHNFTASTPPVPAPVSTPTPPAPKEVRSIEQVDFLNFTFSLSEDCMKKTVSLRNGEFKDKEIRVQLRRKILYADLTGGKINQAIVPLDCDTYGNFFITDIFFYTLRNGEPALLAKLPQSIIERDYKRFYPEGFAFEIRRVQATNGKLIIYRGVDGSHACPANEARFEYIWNGRSFVLSDKPVKRPIKNC